MFVSAVLGSYWVWRWYNIKLSNVHWVSMKICFFNIFTHKAQNFYSRFLKVHILHTLNTYCFLVKRSLQISVQNRMSMGDSTSMCAWQWLKKAKSNIWMICFSMSTDVTWHKQSCHAKYTAHTCRIKSAAADARRSGMWGSTVRVLCLMLLLSLPRKGSWKEM